MVARTVGAGHTGTVEHEGHARTVQCDIHQHLIEGPAHERGVERDDGVQSAVCQPRGGGDRVLLGDPHVVHAIGEPLGERGEARRSQHGGRHRDDIAALLPHRDEGVREHVGPAATAGRQRLTRRGVDLPHRMELVGLVVSGGW